MNRKKSKENKSKQSSKRDHFVEIFLRFPEGTLEDHKKLDAIFKLEEILTEIVEEAGLGNFDGNELGEDTVTFFIYGSDAEKIVENLFPIISGLPYLAGSYILKRYGDTEAFEEQTILR